MIAAKKYGKERRVEFFPINSGNGAEKRYGWRVRATNGEIVMAGEPNGYYDLADAKRRYRSALKTANAAAVHVVLES